MSENNPPPPNDSGLELDLPPPPPGPQPTRTQSNPSLAAVRSASRANPLPSAPAPKKLTKAKLQEGAVDTLLNSVSILAEMMEDFRSSDRFFKYKAGVLGVWLFLSVSSFAVACPGQGPSNDIDAQLITIQGSKGTVYSVKNASKESWVNVRVVVNQAYQSSLNRVEPNAQMLLSPTLLSDTNGVGAPDDLVVTDIVVDVEEPSSQVHMLKDGRPQMK